MKKNKEISKAERTRQYIIEKAAPIFNKKGYSGTSLSDLIEATGLTKGAIYGNFRNKDEIAIESYEFNLSLIRDVINLTQTNEDNAVNKLLFIPKFYRNKFRELGALGGCPILNAAIEADDNNQLLHKKVQQTINNWKGSIEKIVNEGRAKGQIKKEVVSSQFASVIISLIEGGIMLTMILNDPNPMMSSLDRVELMIKEIKT
ncbi:MAG: TetR/AcrR family transcriptional regulator [Bacteroidetes bacterium]|nr:TetR/AcrR family transcriptional regulator [Bacteroidota bacterium]